LPIIEGAKFWLSVMNNVRTRRSKDILIAVVDGLKGFPDPSMPHFPETTAKPALSLVRPFPETSCGWKDSQNVAKTSSGFIKHG